MAWHLVKCAALAGAVMLGATTAAQADPVSIAILSWIGITAAAGSPIVLITTFALYTAASIGLSYLAAALMPKPKTPDISSLPGGTTGKLQSGGTVPRSFLVGRAMTAGSLVYANTYSPAAATDAATALSLTTAAAGNTPNAYLVQVIALSDIPVTGLVGMFVGSTAVTYNSGATPSLEGIAVPEYTASGTDYLWVRFYDGSQVAADPTLVQIFGADADRPYTSARIGTGVAYAVVTSLVNRELFPGFPQFKFVLDGVPLYDRRYDTSVGGSGTQRWSTPSTWALTANNIVIAENILRGISYGGKWVYGAQTVTTTQLPSASWTAAASECDSAIDLAAGGTEPQFYVGGEIRFDVEPAATIEELLKRCNGRLAEIGGTYKIRAGAAGSAVFSFTDLDILSTEQQTFEPFPSLGQTVNAVTAKYVSPVEGWMPKDAPPLYDATLETADGGRRQPVDINYSFVTSGTQVQRLMRSARDDHRAMRRHALPMPPDAFVLEPLDIVSWSSDRNGYVSKLFEIISAEDLPNLNMGLALREIDPNAYDWTPGTDELPITDVTPILVRPGPQPIVDWNAVPWTILSDDNRALPGIKLSWDPNTVDISGIRFEVRIAATAEVIHQGDTDSFAAGSIIISHNLISNTAYQARGQYRPASVRDVTWSDWLDVTTPDIRTTTLTSFEDGLRDFVTGEFQRVTDLANETAGLIASVAAEQDAANWIEKIKSRQLLATTGVTILDAAEVTADQAIAAYDVTVQATYGTIGNIATAKSEAISTAAANATSAIASYATTVDASFGTTNANVTSVTSAVATINGHAAAAWTVSTNVNGEVAGVELLNGGSGTSVFKVNANAFQVALAGTTGGTSAPAFQVANVGGVPHIAIRADVIADGTISATKMVTGTITAASAILANAAVTTLKLAGNAVSSVATQTLTNLLIDGVYPAASIISQSVTGLPIGTVITAFATFSSEVGYIGSTLNEYNLIIDATQVHRAYGTTIDYTITLVGTKQITITSDPQTITAQFNCSLSADASVTTRTIALHIYKR